MSFFGRGGQSGTPPPPGAYSRGDNSGYSSLPSGPRGGNRPPPPSSVQYNAPSQGYNDPASALFEKRGYDQRPPPNAPRRGGGGGGSGGGSYAVVGAPNDLFALSNRLAVNASDFQDFQHVLVNGQFPLTVKIDDTGKTQPGTVGASAMQRGWIGLSIQGDTVTVEPLSNPPYLQSLDLEIGFVRKQTEVSEQYSADELTKHFIKCFDGVLMSEGETIVFEYHGQNIKGAIKGVSILEIADEQRRGPTSALRGAGVIMSKTDVTFMKAADSNIKLKSSAKKAPPNAILAPNFKFEDMGIGGLDNEFNDIFRRAFASRVFPPGLVDKLGIQHVKGLLLHGPPGTGKTLIARQIGKMLNAREPKIVNGPEILNKYVGASEENIRKLFIDAEKEYKEKGDESGLHIIIFDELDAIFKQRGSSNNGTGVGDTVVNQILSKMDGVDQLNNILIIGMTNRKDMIDEALLRPGRLEVHMEISLPDEKGRWQILNIHTAKMRTNQVMDDDVDLHELAAVTKNFSGAEIGGLIKSATSFAFNRHVKVGTFAGISDDVENLRVNRQDFLAALDEVHPAFGVSEEELQQVIQNGIIRFDPRVDEIIKSGRLLVEQVKTSTRTPLVTTLLHGSPGAGKTALAASIAQASEYPFIKLISPDSMVGFSESQKVSAINKVFSDSYKSPLSVIVVDNLERLIEWTSIGPRFSNPVLQALLVLFSRRPPKGRRLLVLATTSLRPVLTECGFTEFDSELRVPPITNVRALEVIIKEVDLFPNRDDRKDTIRLLEDSGFASSYKDETNSKLHIGVKKLLSIIEMARQEPENAKERLISALMGLGM